MDHITETLKRAGYDVNELGTVNRGDATGIIVSVSRNGAPAITMVLTETLDVDGATVHPGVPASLYLASA
jgi:hypothetical protein